MKTPVWEKGDKSLHGSYFQKNSMMLNFNAPVTVGMHVAAQLKGVIVGLQVTEEVGNEIFKAVVKGDYFLNETDELNDGDEVTISRDFIMDMRVG